MRERGEVNGPRDDAPTLDMPAGFWDSAKPQKPKTKEALSMRVDPDILEFFRGMGDGYQTRMHSVLRAYVDAQKNRHTPS